MHVEVSQIEIDYWFINILSNHDIKSDDYNNGRKEGWLEKRNFQV